MNNSYDLRVLCGNLMKIAEFREPDLIIGGKDNPYLKRWYIMRDHDTCCVYLHQFLRSDDDRALHDHPWDNTSVLLHGRYLEHTPNGVFYRKAGDISSRPATALHRIELINGEPTWSLFITGQKIRDWGFDCPDKGWVPWQEFVDPTNSGEIGKGCGE